MIIVSLKSYEKVLQIEPPHEYVVASKIGIVLIEPINRLIGTLAAINRISKNRADY